MLRRVSANLLLKSVIAVVGIGLVVVLAAGAWDAWRALETANRLQRITDVAGYAFRAMQNLRLDRAFTARVLNVDGMADAETQRQLKEIRDVELPALTAAAAALRTVDIPDRDAVVAQFDRATQAYLPLVQESAGDMLKPKGERRAGLAKEIEAAAGDVLAILIQLSDTFAAQAKYGDPFVDQMLVIRDAGWLMRVNAGDMSIVISAGLALKQKLTAADLQRYTNLRGRVEAGWELIGKLSNGAAFPPELTAAIDKIKTRYFAPEFTAMADKALAALASGDAAPFSAGEWTKESVPRIATTVGLAEVALDVGKQHALGQVAAAQWNLMQKLALMAAAVLVAGVGFILVSRRVIRPLSSIQGAMMKVADGDLDVEVPYSDREDEIGALAHALTTFKSNAGEKARIEAEQATRRAQAGERQKAVEAHIAAFERHIGEALKALATASDDMRKTSDKLSSSAETTNRQAKDAADSSANASNNVQTVAAASQELSASIGEIGRQVTHAASIAGRAVAETQETDATVQGLTDAAQHIGQIVGLINEIAEQTNLLALNATIEAARAGEAGKGFAVVAAEVKSLANQTAKATGEISGQVGAIQEVAEKAVQAMRRIGGTIGEVNSVATSIASAVEEQGAATQEITRNTQEAARRTGDVASSITGVTAGADATGLAAADVRTSSDALSRQADKLRHEVDDFLAKIRAA
ncbi:MAG TPA: HAMP domain-containing methyl-accepting chemotaxis protein [Xanthobacteraceae bacterium]|nr:HAMP domain-containing methyl-accepting chemotaxis protein [Xanthobacteraceae bacterium]